MSEASPAVLPWLAMFSGLQTDPALEDVIAVFNEALVTQLLKHALQLEEVTVGPPSQQHVLEGRLNAATVDEAWSRAIQIRNAAAPAAWAAHDEYLKTRTNLVPFAWHGPGVGVSALRCPGETEEALVRRSQAHPSAKTLRGMNGKGVRLATTALGRARR